MLTNTPDLWQKLFPRPDAEAHKYTRGHLAVLGAPVLTGATRLAASAASRSGAGLVSVLADPAIANVYRTSLPPDLMVSTDGADALTRPTALLAGPGGISAPHAEFLRATDLPTILDADTLPFWQNTASPAVLTPHAGEFAKLFPDITGDRRSSALMAARRCACVIVLKGAETLIAAPDGRVVCNLHASPYLAKAGTGDVLAGMIAGLVTQGMPAFEAAAAAVWIHGDAGLRIGPGLIAGDIIDKLPLILTNLLGT